MWDECICLVLEYGHVWFMFLKKHKKHHFGVLSENYFYSLNLMFFRIKRNWEPNVFSVFSSFSLF